MPSKIAVVILAAGASRRIGKPKQLLKWGDETLITHTLKTALKLNTNNIYVVLGANFQIIQKTIQHFPVTILNNNNWEQGLGTSIAWASKYIQEQGQEQKLKVDALLFILADQPFITSDYLNELISSFSPQKKQIIASSYQNRKFGVPAIFDTYYLNQLSKLNDDFGARHILKVNESFVKALKPPVKNVDLDFKEDYERLHKKNFE
jgi:molybdenum cofactor cytidylyltransferase